MAHEKREKDLGGFRFRCGNHYHIKARRLRECRERQLEFQK